MTQLSAARTGDLWKQGIVSGRRGRCIF